MSLNFIAAALLLAVYTSTANAIVIVEKVDHPKKVVVLKVQGSIKKTDHEDFQKALDQIKNENYKIKLNSVVLNTKGGNVEAAIAIGKTIRKERLNSYVGPKDICASACIYILSSGVIRMAYGEVSVHRGTHHEDYPIEKIEEALKTVDLEKHNHLFEMGMTTQLVDAIRVTPNWTIWTLDEKEKRRWGVHGVERLYEELWFRTTAKAKHYEISVVRDFFYKHYDKCNQKAKDFKETIFDCVRGEM
jgi:hypothetical protein